LSFCFFFLYCSGAHLDLHSFPTRRSSDLMKLSQFKFNLPESLIANEPTENRDESRLMVLDRKTGKIEHKIFKDVLDYFDDKDVRSEEHTSELQSRENLVCRLLLEKKKKKK